MVIKLKIVKVETLLKSAFRVVVVVVVVEWYINIYITAIGYNTFETSIRHYNRYTYSYRIINPRVAFIWYDRQATYVCILCVLLSYIISRNEFNRYHDESRSKRKNDFLFF